MFSIGRFSYASEIIGLHLHAYIEIEHYQDRDSHMCVIIRKLEIDCSSFGKSTSTMFKA
jgi:hypothetical protein